MFHVDIMASRRNGRLYTRMTDHLNRRGWQHQTGAIPNFTRRYGAKLLVWHEPHELRERALRSGMGHGSSN